MISLGLLLPTSRQGYCYTSTSEGTDIGLRLNNMRGLSRTRVVREGRRYFCVPVASSERQLWPSFFAFTFDNVNYVSWCTVRGASVFMLEYRSVDSSC